MKKITLLKTVMAVLTRRNNKLINETSSRWKTHNYEAHDDGCLCVRNHLLSITLILNAAGLNRSNCLLS